MATTLALSTASDVLKEDYKDLKDQLNQNMFLLAQIEKDTENVQGKRAYHALHVSRSSGVGARAELGTLPTPTKQGYTHGLIPIRSNYGQIQVSGQVIKAMASDQGSFIRAVKSEMDGISKDLKRDVNRQAWGTSNGVIATCGTTSTSTTVQLIATTTQTQMRQLGADGSSLVVDIGTVAAPTTVASARTITAVDTANLTVTISGATVSTTSGTHFIFRTGAGGATDNTGANDDGQIELTGLQSIVSNTGYLHAINSSTYPVWKSYISANSGTNRAYSENLVTTAIMETEIASGLQVDLLVANGGVARAIANDQRAQRRNNDTVELKAGYKGIAFSSALEGLSPSSKERAIVWEKDCPEGKLWGLSTDSLVEYVMSDWDWMDQDGSVLARVGNSTDAYGATYFKYHELACKQRNANFRIDDLTGA